MLKKIIGAVVFVIIIGVLIFGAVNRSLAKVNGESTNLYQEGYSSNNTQSQSYVYQGEGASTQGHGAGTSGSSSELINLPAASGDELSESEVAGLLYMREEGEVAPDVYTTLYSPFSATNFQ